MKVIDSFIFYNELDMLKFRLNELNDIVDYFVIVECTKTFANADKELYFENNKEQFSKYLDKIIHIIVKENIPVSSDPWEREKYQRNCIDDGIKKLNLNIDDIVIISDLDEIPDVNTVLNFKNNIIDDICTLEMDFYYYNINCQFADKWHQSKICNYGTYVKYNTPNTILKLPPGQVIKNGGWHLSYFGDIEFIKNKVKNFSHQEYNNENILNDDRIKKQIQNNDDLFGRSYSINYIDIKDNPYLPYKYEEFKDFLLKKS